jgi:hypothetical protein
VIVRNAITATVAAIMLTTTFFFRHAKKTQRPAKPKITLQRVNARRLNLLIPIEEEGISYVKDIC